MFRTISVAVVGLSLLLPQAGAQEKPETVSFKSRAPVVGEFQGSKYKTGGKTVMRMGDAEAEGRESGSSLVVSRDATILESKDGKVAKVRLHWREVEEKNDRPAGLGAGGGRGGRRGGEDRPTRPDFSELLGKTLILDLATETPTVTAEDGSPVDEGLARMVVFSETRDGQFVGWSPDVLGALGRKDFTVGERVTFSQEAGRTLLGNVGGGLNARGPRGRRGNRGGEEPPAEAAEPEATYEGSVVFKGRRNVLGHDCGLFEISVTSSSERNDERGQSSTKSTVTGEMLVGIENGWLYKIELKNKNSMDSAITRGERSFEMHMMSDHDLSRQVLFAAPKAAPAN
ncbi:MAG: hypothetical protein H6807_11130 [Planctomycetes bacterium]|nr:hypothetical protein [Planctomycetota bacterium]